MLSVLNLQLVHLTQSSKFNVNTQTTKIDQIRDCSYLDNHSH